MSKGRLILPNFAIPISVGEKILPQPCPTLPYLAENQADKDCFIVL